MSGHVSLRQFQACLLRPCSLRPRALLICSPTGIASSSGFQRNDSIMQLNWTKHKNTGAHYPSWRSNLWPECKQKRDAEPREPSQPRKAGTRCAAAKSKLSPATAIHDCLHRPASIRGKITQATFLVTAALAPFTINSRGAGNNKGAR